MENKKDKYSKLKHLLNHPPNPSEELTEAEHLFSQLIQTPKYNDKENIVDVMLYQKSQFLVKREDIIKRKLELIKEAKALHYLLILTKEDSFEEAEEDIQSDDDDSSSLDLKKVIMNKMLPQLNTKIEVKS